MTKVVTLTPDGRDVLIEGPVHTDRFPVEELASRLAFYRELRDRKCERTKTRRFAAQYAETVSGLEALKKELEE
ncbi:hypothetical protein [Maritimibacter alexandrii]|uniref:hypothetical protein n=1 Tax=Maritimibacter alexandrii TaxID=2570355 RepID=UPI001109AB87|nr:hypothetical protein [Maritimibacter alexandrii]